METYWREAFFALVIVGISIWNAWIMRSLDSMKSRVDEKFTEALDRISAHLDSIQDIKRRVYESAVSQAATREQVQHLNKLVGDGLITDIKKISQNLAELQGKCAAYTQDGLPHGKK